MVSVIIVPTSTVNKLYSDNIYHRLN